MKKAVMYGAGNIGRGFIGQLFSESGYEVVFIDVNNEIVKKMNEDRCYPIRVVSEKGCKKVTVNNVRAVNGLDVEQVSTEIAEADIMATAVGVNVLSRIAGPIAQGLKERWKKGNMKTLNIIICENLIDANHYLKGLLNNRLEGMEKEYLQHLVGFVETSIGRMVPVMTQEMQEGNILRVCVEEYGQLPVDKDGFKGEIPYVKNMLPYSPFEYYIQRKLFIHNMGHAITAYLGYLKGYKFIWEAIDDIHIRNVCKGAMMESALALSKEHNIEIEKVEEHVDDLIARFRNRQLGDTIERVGRDLQRKLSPNDRLIGALNLCVKNGIEPKYICEGTAAALHFKDPVVGVVSDMLVGHGPEEVLAKVCGLVKGAREWNCIIECYNTATCV